MIIVYDSLTGKGKLFAEALNLDIPKIDINKVTEINDDVFLLTRSFNFGEIPETTENFLKRFSEKVIGVAVSGNKNWGRLIYGMAGERIEDKYGIPLVLKYELMGTKEDRKVVEDWIKKRL